MALLVKLITLIAGVKAIQIDEKAKDVSQGDVAKVDLTAMTNAQMMDLQDQYQLMAEGKGNSTSKPID